MEAAEGVAILKDALALLEGSLAYASDMAGVRDAK